MPETLSAKEAAAALGTDARTLRKFLRSKAQDVVEPVGQGKRYAITKDEIKKLKKAFLAWSEGARKKDEDEAVTDVEEVDLDDESTEIDDSDDDDDELEIEDDEDEEPSEDDLMEIELEELD